MSDFKTGEDFYHKIYLRFNGYVAIVLIPFGYLVLQIQAGADLNQIGNDYIRWGTIVLMLAVGGFLIQNARKNFAKGLKDSIDQESLRQKLSHYFQAANTKFISFTLAALIFNVGLFLTGGVLFIVAFVVVMIFISLGRPTLNLIIEELQLNQEEQQILKDKDDID